MLVLNYKNEKMEEKISNNHFFYSDVEYFKKGVVSTTENVAIYIWNQLVNDLPESAKLVQVIPWSIMASNLGYFR